MSIDPKRVQSIFVAAADLPAAGATSFTLFVDGHPHLTTVTRLRLPSGPDADAITKIAAFADA
mgnify:CR=1 FL=1